jgi:FkbM family methyltransferase
LNIKQNKTKYNIHVNEFGLFSEECTRKIYLPKPIDGKYNYGGSSLFYDTHLDENNYILCNFKKLDDVYKGNASFIKIDVEGSELDVLFGATETIKRCKPTIIFECHDKNKLDEFKIFFNKIDNSYKLHEITPSDFLLIFI